MNPTGRKMPAIAKRRATYVDIEALPPNMVGEILDGEFVITPVMPSTRVAVAANSLAGEPGGPFQKRAAPNARWIFLPKPELHFGQTVVVPDLAGWRRERMPTLPEKVGSTIAPDWICEVLSPSTASYDRTAKLRLYHQQKVGHLWYLDPAYRTLEAFGWSEPHWLTLGTFADFEAVSAPPFEGLSIDLGVLWPFDRPEGCPA